MTGGRSGAGGVSCRMSHAEDTVRKFLRQRLASYKVPRRVVFVREEELSLTGSAKVKAGDLRKLVGTRLNGVPK
ncbi:MAG: AMP-binding enzyme [Rhizomicrobium sp.]